MIHIRLLDSIIAILGKTPYIEFPELKKRLNEAGFNFTDQAIFKELRKLLKSDVIIKVKRKYALSIPWMLQRVETTNNWIQNYSKTPVVSQIIEGIEDKQTIRFKDLRRLKRYWSQMVLVLLKNSEDKTLYTWNPHPWQYIVDPDHEKDVMRSIEFANSKMFKIIGNNYYLDNIAKGFWQKKSLNYSYLKSPFHRQQNLYFSVIFPWIISVKLNKKTCDYLEQLFSTTKSLKDLNLAELIDFLENDAAGSLTIENNKKKSLKIKHQFIEFFDR